MRQAANRGATASFRLLAATPLFGSLRRLLWCLLLVRRGRLLWLLPLLLRRALLLLLPLLLLLDLLLGRGLLLLLLLRLLLARGLLLSLLLGRRFPLLLRPLLTFCLLLPGPGFLRNPLPHIRRGRGRAWHLLRLIALLNSGVPRLVTVVLALKRLLLLGVRIPAA